MLRGINSQSGGKLVPIASLTHAGMPQSVYLAVCACFTGEGKRLSSEQLPSPMTQIWFPAIKGLLPPAIKTDECPGQ